jgi:hypothetical protein
VALAALATARRALPAYSHPSSPKKFTQHQLFACLVLKNFLKTDYRGIVAHLADHPPLVAALELTKIPHFTTVEKAAKRLLKSAPARRLVEATVRLHMGRRRRVARSAIDSTGFECTCASGYFVRRRVRVSEPWKSVVYHHFAKLGIVCDSDDHFILACRVGRRSQVETVISMLKRRQGAHVRAHSHHGRCRNLRLLALTHNVMILWR